MIAVSAGIHAHGVTHHTTRQGNSSAIAVPKFAPLVKIDNSEWLSAEFVQVGRITLALERLMAQLGQDAMQTT